MAKAKNLSAEERIKRIEMAPVEVQTMVAKAFLREDIDDENVQYLFNTDTLAELNDPAEDAGIENIDAEQIEGIGAGNFFIRSTKPNGNKNFITTGKGGWNTCIYRKCNSGKVRETAVFFRPDHHSHFHHIFYCLTTNFSQNNRVIKWKYIQQSI